MGANPGWRNSTSSLQEVSEVITVTWKWLHDQSSSISRGSLMLISWSAHTGLISTVCIASWQELAKTIVAGSQPCLIHCRTYQFLLGSRSVLLSGKCSSSRLFLQTNQRYVNAHQHHSKFTRMACVLHIAGKGLHHQGKTMEGWKMAQGWGWVWEAQLVPHVSPGGQGISTRPTQVRWHCQDTFPTIENAILQCH